MQRAVEQLLARSEIDPGHIAITSHPVGEPLRVTAWTNIELLGNGVVVGGALARVALGFDGAIPLIAPPNIQCILWCDGAGPLEPAHRSARARRRQHTTAAHFGTVAFSSPKSVDVSKIDGPFAGWDSSRGGRSCEPSHTACRFQLDCGCSYPPPRGGWLFLQLASL